MSDIADALRAWATPIEQEMPVPAAGQVMRNGADGIDRLRAALRLIRINHGAADWETVAREAARVANEALGK